MPTPSIYCSFFPETPQFTPLFSSLGSQAITLFEEFSPDIVILDITLPTPPDST
jgi:Response regulator containing CheY-like receiver domain and AraC-type DNA-binding domain